MADLNAPEQRPRIVCEKLSHLGLWVRANQGGHLLARLKLLVMLPFDGFAYCRRTAWCPRQWSAEETLVFRLEKRVRFAACGRGFPPAIKIRIGRAEDLILRDISKADRQHQAVSPRELG